MNKIVSVFILIFLLFLNSCTKFQEFDRVEACFVLEEETYSVGDTVVFIDCSKFYKNNVEIERNHFASWLFGDGSYYSSSDEDTVYHVYEKGGEYMVLMATGAKHGPLERVEQIITITE